MSTEENKAEIRASAEKSMKINQKSVLNYLLILFAAAFFLMALTYLMERRNAENEFNLVKTYADGFLSDLRASEDEVDTLIAALSTAETEIKHLQEDFTALQQEYLDYTADMQTQLDEANALIAALQENLDQLTTDMDDLN